MNNIQMDGSLIYVILTYLIVTIFTIGRRIYLYRNQDDFKLSIGDILLMLIFIISAPISIVGMIVVYAVIWTPEDIFTRPIFDKQKRKRNEREKREAEKFDWAKRE